MRADFSFRVRKPTKYWCPWSAKYTCEKVQTLKNEHASDSIGEFGFLTNGDLGSSYVKQIIFSLFEMHCMQVQVSISCSKNIT